MPKKPGKPSPKKTAAKSRTKKITRVKSAKTPAAKTQQQASQPLQQSGNYPATLPTAWQLAKRAGLTMWQHKELFIGITLIYGLLNVSLAQSLAGGTDINTVKHALSQVFTGNFGLLLSGVSIFALLVGSAGSTANQAAGAYQVFLAIIASMAIIWALRQVASGARPRVRDAYYRGMYPLIPFILVLVIIGFQLLPLALGSTLYSTVINNGIAIHAIEKIICLGLFMALASITFYLLSSSLFALYIVTLPDMAPMQALRSARDLVRNRRWAVARKILFLPVILLVVAAVIMLPVIILVTPLARWMFFLLTMFTLAAIHAYMYALYRELLNE